MEKLRDKWIAWHYGRRVEPAVRIDEAVFDNKLDYLVRLVDDPGTSTEVKIISGKVVLIHQNQVFP